MHMHMYEYMYMYKYLIHIRETQEPELSPPDFKPQILDPPHMNPRTLECRRTQRLKNHGRRFCL